MIFGEEGGGTYFWQRKYKIWEDPACVNSRKFSVFVQKKPHEIVTWWSLAQNIGLDWILAILAIQATKQMTKSGRRHSHDRMVVVFTTTLQSLPITSEDVSVNSAQVLDTTVCD
jgi:uncharacterized membrane protein